MSAPPYMKLYVADYLADTMGLTATEHGAYLLMLMAMWRAGGKLPAADKNLAAIVKATPKEWAELKPVIMPFFTVRRGVVTHKRVARELASCEATSCKRSEAAKRGVEKKRNAFKPQASAFAEQNDSKSTHNQISEPDKSSDTNVSGGEPPGVIPFDPDKRAWDDARALLGGGVALFGKLLSEHRLQARDMSGALASALANRTGDPAAYLTKAAAGVATRRAAGALGRGNASFT